MFQVNARKEWRVSEVVDDGLFVDTRGNFEIVMCV
jgi:hypothetical protein